MKKFRFLHAATTEAKELTLSGETTLKEAKGLLGSFFEARDRFIYDSERQVDEDDEPHTTLDDVENEGVVQILKEAVAQNPASNSSAKTLGKNDGQPATSLTPAPAEESTAKPELKPSVLPDVDASSMSAAFKGGLGGQAAELGWGPSIGTPGTPDKINNLNKAGQQLLLKNNRVHVADDGSVIASAFVLGTNGQLSWASNTALTCKEAHLTAPDKLRKDHATSSYSEYEREWSKQAAGVGHFNVGIPLLFNIDSRFKHVQDQAGFAKGNAHYLQATNNLSMAHLQLRNIGITAEFKDKISEALAGGANPASGAKLLNLFKEYGEFVALDQVLGGRVSLSTHVQTNQASSLEKSFTEFQAAANARFSAEGVPVEAGGGVGTNSRSTASEHRGIQKRNLDMEVVGGIGRYASSKVDRMDADWMSTVDRFENWGVIGFNKESVVPIIEFVGDQKNACIQALQEYFLDKLIVKDTNAKGNVATNEWFDDVPSRSLEDRRRSYHRRISEVYFQFDRCMDSIRTVWRDPNGSLIKQQDPKWHGGGKNNADNAYNKRLQLDVDEEIVSAEIWSDNSVDALRFYTSKGRYLPTSGKFGSNSSDNRPIEKITAPRVRGFWGTDKDYVDSFGFRYMTLGSTAGSRDYLLLLEPTLFPF